MRIDATSSPKHVHARHEVAHRQVQPTQLAETPTEPPAEPPVEPPADLPVQPPVEQPAAERQRGVIRLLQEGHFKGVADLRLRINFFDELAAAGTEQQPIAEPPAGKGKAYEKFLAIYEQMAGGPESNDEPPDEPAVEESA